MIMGALTATILLCWAWIVPMARDMYGEMDGPSAWMMPHHWDFPHLVLLFAMWVVMMIGMMLPSAAPALLLYAGVVRKSRARQQVRTQVYAFASGYLLVWTAFSLLATILQRLLSDWMLLSPMMESRAWLGGVLLVVAGAYQLTPFKRSCLETCRSPVNFIVGHWQRGVTGALRLGIAHGTYCLGCCWALMLLLFVGGVMNLWWIAALTIFVLLEKVAPLGAQGGRLSGLLMLILGLFYLVRN